MKSEIISRKTVLVGVLTIILCFTGGLTARARISYTCSFGEAGCHQMHGGESPYLMAPGYGGNQGCINCHSSDTSSTMYILNPGGDPEIVVPVVVYTGTDEPTSYLAGGNFWWVKEGLGGDDTKGHNIFSGEPDDNLPSAPLSAGGCAFANFCHANFHTEYTGAEGIRQGCTKCHMMKDGGWGGFHHADDTLDPVVGGDPGDTDGYFRFLTGHMSGAGHGVCGIEDEYWESPDAPPPYTLSSSVHNEYLGYSGSKDTAGSLSMLGHTMTGFCCGCHGNKHISQDPGGENWIRHPSGAFPLDELYTEYNPQNPVSRPDLSGYDGPSSTVAPATDMVMCLSCHRAHGSPYPKMLRWETVGGCDDCHISTTQCAP
jgi:predicted CXXCH cytochrome family protein